MPVAQIPGADEAIDAAINSGHGYEAVVLVVVMLGGMALLAFLLRLWVTKASEREDRILQQAVDREQRLSNRVSELEQFVRTALLDALKESTKATLTISISVAEQSRSLIALQDTIKEIGLHKEHLANSLMQLAVQLKAHDEAVEPRIRQVVQQISEQAGGRP